MKIVLLCILIHAIVCSLFLAWAVKKIDNIKQKNLIKIQRLLQNQQENTNKINFIIEKFASNEKKIDIILNEIRQNFQEKRIQSIEDIRSFNNTQ